jgi:chromosome partitioning protein
MRTVVVTNQKGGAGKTVLSAQAVYFALEKGLRVFALDFDPQGSLSRVHFKDSPARIVSSDFLSTPLDVVPELVGNLLVGVGNPTLRKVAVDEKILKANLAKLKGHVDVVIIDTAGSINSFAQAALMCATHVVCPVEVGDYELDALEPLLKDIQTIKQRYNPKLINVGLLPSRVRTVSSSVRQDVQALRDALGKLVLPQQLAVREAVRQTIKQKKPVWKLLKDKAERQQWLGACEAMILA